MTKSLAAIATAILAATTLLSSAAQAGLRVHFGFGGGPAPYLTDYNKESAQGYKPSKRYRAARRQESAPVRTTKKKASTSVAKVEKVETKTTAETTAETENSSISLAQAEVAQTTAAPQSVKTTEAIPSEDPAGRPIDCKKFFATVGLTLTVPCE